jgi:hypothetical protein
VFPNIFRYLNVFAAELGEPPGRRANTPEREGRWVHRGFGAVSWISVCLAVDFVRRNAVQAWAIRHVELTVAFICERGSGRVRMEFAVGPLPHPLLALRGTWAAQRGWDGVPDWVARFQRPSGPLGHVVNPIAAQTIMIAWIRCAQRVWC